MAAGGEVMMVGGKGPRAVLACVEEIYVAIRLLSRCPTYTVIAAALLLTAHAAFAADKARTATPDFSGTWDRYPDPWPPGPIPEDPPPPGGEPELKEPYATERKKLEQRKAAANKEGRPVLESSARCVPEGMPTIMGAVHPIEILQTPQQIVVLAEFLTQTRRVYLNEKMPPLEDISPSYNGYAVGRWQGDTLVIETIGIRDDVKFFDFPRSAEMKITERLRVTGPDLLENQITIEDPAVLVRPYKFTFGYKRSPEYRIMEYNCDNNRYSPDAEGKSSLDVSTK
jgi:hypothetical protein